MRADMSDALDRIVPEDKAGKGLYRHDAEGSDDMPVSLCCTKPFPYGITRVGKGVRCTKAKWNLGLGTCQERPDWGERHSSYQQW